MIFNTNFIELTVFVHKTATSGLALGLHYQTRRLEHTTKKGKSFPKHLSNIWPYLTTTVYQCLSKTLLGTTIRTVFCSYRNTPEM
jgi:hypothetical protein